MQVWMQVGDEVRKFGGRMVGGDTKNDGADYHFRSTWDEAEQIEAFMDEHGDKIYKSDTDFIDGYLTFFFSVKGAGE